MELDDLMARTMELARTFDKRAQSQPRPYDIDILNRDVAALQQVLEGAVRPHFDTSAAQPQLMPIPSIEQAPAPGIQAPPPTVSLSALERGSENVAPIGEIGMATGAPEVAPAPTAPVPYAAGPAGIQGEVARALQQAPQGVPLTPQEQFQSTSRLQEKQLGAQTPEQRAEWLKDFQSPEMLNNLVAAMGRGQVGPQQLRALDYLQARSGSQLPLGELGEDYSGADPEMLERTRIADTMASALRNNPALFDDPRFMEAVRATAGGETVGWSSRLPDVLKGHTEQLADEANRQAAIKAMDLPGIQTPVPAPATPVAPPSAPPDVVAPAATPSGGVVGPTPDLAGALNAPAFIPSAPLPTPTTAAPPPPITPPTPPAPVVSLPGLPAPAPVPTPVVATGPQVKPTAAGEMGMRSWGQQAGVPDIQWAAGGTPVGLQRAPGGSPVGTLAVGGFGGGSASGQPTPIPGFPQTPPRNPFTHVAALGIIAPLFENLYQKQPGLVKEAADLGMQAFILATQDLKEFAGSESFQEAMAKVAVSIPGIDPKETEMLTKAAQTELVGRLLAHGQLFRMSVAPSDSE